jgi:hypothetical protein
VLLKGSKCDLKWEDDEENGGVKSSEKGCEEMEEGRKFNTSFLMVGSGFFWVRNYQKAVGASCAIPDVARHLTDPSRP